MVTDERLPHVMGIEEEVSNGRPAGSQQEESDESADDQYRRSGAGDYRATSEEELLSTGREERGRFFRQTRVGLVDHGGYGWITGTLV
jgi:hypothetical protein